MQPCALSRSTPLNGKEKETVVINLSTTSRNREEATSRCTLDPRSSFSLGYQKSIARQSPASTSCLVGTTMSLWSFDVLLPSATSQEMQILSLFAARRAVCASHGSLNIHKSCPSPVPAVILELFSTSFFLLAGGASSKLLSHSQYAVC